jgi:cyclopropane-fatty-acyl-phospholipid synthase
MSHSDVAARNLQSKRGLAFPDRWIARQIVKAVGSVPVRLVVEDGVDLTPPGISPIATVVFKDRATLARLAFDPEIAFGEAYANGRIEVQGDLEKVLEEVNKHWPERGHDGRWYQRLMSKWMSWRQDNSRIGSRKNIHSHYDLGNDFYKLWLDDRMVYTCAYFPSPEVTLEAAQEAKLDYVCRKLRLRPGEKVAEAGCGWGSLALHMARHYGVSVKAFNISHEQIEYARRQAAAQGLSDRVEFIEDDYRNVSRGFDVFVSIGMLEHVGLRHYGEFGLAIHRAIGSSGRGLIHFIGRTFPGDFSRWIRRRIFPGAYVPTLAQASAMLQPHRYRIWDVENLRPHYAKTLEHWLQRFENEGPKVLEKYGAWFQRAWRLYLAGSMAGFRTGSLQLFQICFTGPDAPQESWTRTALYADGKF